MAVGEQQRHVDPDPGGDRFFHGGQALGSAGDLYQQVGEAGLLVQPASQGDRRRGVVGDVWGYLQRHIPVHAGGAFPFRPE
jgi:hypothetical protein